MTERRSNTRACRAVRLAGFISLCASAQAWAQTSYIAPDGRNRFPAVTIFCPSGTGVAPCNFGGGGTGGSMSLVVSGQAVSASNRLPVTDTALDSLISGGALPVSGALTLSGTPTVNLAGGTNNIGAVNVTSLPALPAGSNGIGSVTVSNFPASQAVTGSVSQSGSWTMGLVSGSIVGLAPGTNAIGSVSVSNFPSTQPVSAAALPLPAGAATSALQAAPLAPVAPGSATATNATLIGCLANTTLPSFAAGQQGALPCDTAGRLYVDIGANANGNLPTYLTAQASGGAVTGTVLNAASSTISTNFKSASGQIYVLDCSNSNGTGVWVRIYTSASAVTVGSGTPVWRSYCPPGGKTWAFDLGLAVGTGISVTVTGGAGDSDTTAILTASTVALNIGYK